MSNSTNFDIPLNGSFSAEITVLTAGKTIPEGFIPLFSLEALDNWVIKEDNGPRYATRYSYTTTYAVQKHFEFRCGNAKAAIQQAAIHVTGGELIKNLAVRIKNLAKSTGS